MGSILPKDNQRFWFVQNWKDSQNSRVLVLTLGRSQTNWDNLWSPSFYLSILKPGFLSSILPCLTICESYGSSMVDPLMKKYRKLRVVGKKFHKSGLKVTYIAYSYVLLVRIQPQCHQLVPMLLGYIFQGGELIWD